MLEIQTRRKGHGLKVLNIDATIKTIENETPDKTEEK